MKRITMNFNEEVIKNVDRVRGFVPRSTFVNETLRQKVEQIKEKGGIAGQV